MNVNQEGFDRRLAIVQQILQQHSLQSKDVKPIAYVEHCPFPFNNFIYRVDLAQAATATVFPGQQPCTTPAPATGASTLVVRLSNPRAEGLNNANRVENEVATQFLVRQSFIAKGLDPLIPAVYAWGPCRYPQVDGEEGFGWVIAEFMSGEDLDGLFPEMPLEEALSVVEQMADIFAVLQGTNLPPSVVRFGAFALDADGKLETGQMPLLKGGPWDRYDEVWAVRLRTQLRDADKSPLLRGWVDGGLRARIGDFIEQGGISEVLKPVDVHQRVLVHGDFTMNNMLYDKTTKRITSLLDFDWSFISHFADEFLAGLWDIGGGIHERVGKLQPMVLSGDFGTKPPGDSPEETRAWEVAKAWNAAILKRGCIAPSTIAGIDRVQALKNLEDLLCPFHLGNTVMLKRISEEDQTKRRAETEGKIIAWLEKHTSPTT